MTKVWANDFGNPEKALRTSLKKLGVDYVDNYLIHWPCGFWQGDDKNRLPVHKVWKKLERLVDMGLTKSIGVSNFNL